MFFNSLEFSPLDAFANLMAMGFTMTNVGTVYGLMLMYTVLLYPLMRSLYLHGAAMMDAFYSTRAMAGLYLTKEEVEEMERKTDVKVIYQLFFK
jgi:hypothetical protein